MKRAFIIGFGWLATLGACAAEVEDDFPPSITPTSASTTSGAGASGSAVTSGAGGGQGGEGGAGFCGQDCSLIDTMNPCLVAVCNEGQLPGPIGDCVVAPNEGATCDDGLFCTTGDTCDSEGECVGGADNTCGLEASDCEDVTCDEDDDQCELVPKANGESCASGNLCVTGATCLNGLCQGGNPEDCFLQPTPNECFVSVCNPSNGMCEPVVGNDGGDCTDLNDLCTVDKICDNGACVGGIPKDCSGVAQECEIGVCDMATGNCSGAPGMVGDACTQAADEGNAGSCDASGMCQPVPLASGTACPSAIDQCNSAGACDSSGSCQGVPVADGTACNDNQACTNNDACQGGVCTGATTATCSMTADNCCPPSCTELNDVDCAFDCDLYAIASGRQIYSVDEMTGAISQTGSAGAIAATTGELTQDRNTGIVYMSSTSNDSLYTVDIPGGANTVLVGPYGNSSIVMHGLEFVSPTSTLYGYSFHDNGLYTIDTTTGAATLVGTTGLSGFGNLGYDEINGVMYLTSTDTDSLYTIDLVTAAVTLIGPMNGPTNPQGLAYDGETDTLYLSDPGTDTIYTLNRQTGAATPLGNFGSPNLLGLLCYED